MRIEGEAKKRVVLRDRVESDTRPGVFYDVEIWNDGNANCTCPAIKECKHIKRLKKKLPDK